MKVIREFKIPISSLEEFVTKGADFTAPAGSKLAFPSAMVGGHERPEFVQIVLLVPTKGKAVPRRLTAVPLESPIPPGSLLLGGLIVSEKQYFVALQPETKRKVRSGKKNHRQGVSVHRRKAKA